MKKVLTVLLAVLMAGSMVACGGDDAASTTAASTTAGTTTAAKTTTAAPAGSDETPATTEDPSTGAEAFTILADDAEWAYKLFMCPYTPGDPGPGGGFFDPATDEMAQYIEANPEWYKNLGTLSADWTKAQPPFGDRTAGFVEGGSVIGWTGETHGIMLYTTFELTQEQYDTIVNAEDPQFVYMNMFFDNAINLYINGTLAFSYDSDCGNAGFEDWNGEQIGVDFNQEGLDYSTLFKVGTNEISVSLKDCWGGREFLLALEFLPF